MKRCLPPLAVLAAILVLSLWNGRVMERRTSRWQAQLQQVRELAMAERWQAAEAALTDSYSDWSRSQTYLHIITEHDAVDDAEAMYRRSQAFAAAREPSELQAELSDLRDQMRLLAEMEKCSIRNIL